MTAAQHEREPFARVPSRAGWVVGTKRRPVGPNGRGLCRRCGAEVPSGRVTFCGAACVREWKIRTQPGFARRMVEERDRGVCAACGLDTRAAAAWQQRVRDRLAQIEGHVRWATGGALGNGGWMRVSPEHWPTIRGSRTAVERATRAARALLAGTWEADHVTPVAEGGGDCGLENLRTLCSWCHARASGELRRRLNARRRQEPGT